MKNFLSEGFYLSIGILFISLIGFFLEGVRGDPFFFS